jgi:hypothetical protein
MPIERGLMGRLDATFAGVSSSLMGLFSGLVVYRTILFILSLATVVLQPLLEPETKFIAAAIGLASANAVCIWQLFNMAYTSRVEMWDAAESERRASAPITSHVTAHALQSAAVSQDDETDIDEAT